MENIPNNSLRPFTVLEILDRTFGLYRENFWSYAGLVAVVTVPLAVINLIASQGYLTQLQNRDLSLSQQQAATVSYSLIVSLLALVIAVVQAVFITGTLTYMVSENHLGRKITIAESFRQARGRFLTLFLALVVFYLVIIALAFVSALTLTCLIGILGFGLLIYMGISINVFLAPTIVLENVGVLEGINRGFGLAKARFWSVFGLMFLIFIISAVLQVAFAVLQQLFSQQVVASASSQGGVVVATTIETIIAIFITPITSIAFTIMYYALKSQPVEADYGRVHSFLSSRNKKRFLVVLLTDLNGSRPSESLIQHVPRLAPRHLPMLVTIRDPVLDQEVGQRPTTSDALYRRAVAEQMMDER